MTYGSHLNSSRLVMVHWPTTGFLPNGRWSITLITIGGVYISSFGSSYIWEWEWMLSIELRCDSLFSWSALVSTKTELFFPSAFSACVIYIMLPYHFDKQDRAREVWALFHIPDHSWLHHLPTTLYNQTGWGHGGQLVWLHVSQAPCKNLHTHGGCVNTRGLCIFGQTVSEDCVTSTAVSWTTGRMPCGTI